MNILGGLKTLRVKRGRIKLNLESFHRYATGMQSKTKLYIVPIVDAINKTKECMISTVDPAHWHYIWQITVTAEDRRGLIRDLTEILKDVNINVLYHDFLPGLDKQCRFQLTVDISLSVKQKNVNDDDVEMDLFMQTMVLEAIKKINGNGIKLAAKVKDRNVTARCERNMTLNACCYQNDTEGRIPAIIKDRIVSGEFKAQEISSKTIIIEEDILGCLGIEDKKLVESLTISDSEEKFARLTFFNDDQFLVEIDIAHENRKD
jgi:hypothetical protein